MSNSRPHPRNGTSSGRLTLLAFVALALAATGAYGPTVAAERGQERGAPPPMFTTLQLMTQDSQELQQLTVPPRRRRVPRPVAATGAAPADAAVAQEPLEASEPVTFLQSYTAANLGELGSLPPDPSGAAGPAQFIFAANGRIRSFSRGTGGPDGVLNVSTNTFFGSVRNGAATFAPTVKYDRLAGRWFVVMATQALPGRIMIASSNASTITASTVWSFFAFDNSFTGTGCAVDSPTFGLDNAALYIGVVQFCDNGATYAGTSGYVVRKTSVIDGASIVVTPFHGLTGSASGAGPFAPLGVDNDDPASGVGYFIGVDNGSLGTLMLRRVSNPGVTPTISGNISIPVAATALPITVRHAGNAAGTNGQLDGGDDRLTAASLVNGRLWTAQTIGVLSSGQASGAATRNAVRWYELQDLTATPSVAQSGTLFSNAGGTSVNERNYWVPSIATSTRGRTVIGFSAAGNNEYINAGVAERFAADAAGTLRAPQLFTGANDAYNPPGDPGSSRGRRWGGASATVADGCDGSTIWTVQQFADAANWYGLQVGRTLGPPPPTPVSVVPATVASGAASINLQLTASGAAGAAFFDPGAGYLCRIGALIPGVVINSVTLTGPTTVTLNISTVNATPGLKTITVFNPDSQGAVSAPMLRVTPGPFTLIETPRAGAAGQPLLVEGWAVDGNAATGTGVDAVHVYAYPAAAAPVFLGAAQYGQARPDIEAAQGARFARSGFSLVAPATLPVGPYTIVAYGHSTSAGTFNSTATVAVTLTAPAAPIGLVDTPLENSTVSGEVAVTGWAIDDGAVASVDIYRSPVPSEGSNQVYVGRAVFIRGSRPDVVATFPGTQNNDIAGWGFMLLTNMLPNQGNGVFDFYVYATDYGGLSSLIGTRRLNVANSASNLPFGTIDTPGQGATVSGTFVNFGWALAKPGASIPIDGSTIDVYIDNVYRGHPVYNNYRVDIATLFPGLANSNGAVGHFTFDSRQLSNGLHTINWVIRDNLGRTAGVGSRFFRVQN